MYNGVLTFLHRGIGAGGQRNSMFGAYGGPEKMKDPRPLHDKAFVQQCIKQLCEVWLFFDVISMWKEYYALMKSKMDSSPKKL